MAFHNLASEDSFTLTLLYRLKLSKTIPADSRGINQPNAQWEEFQRIYEHILKPPYHFSISVHHHQQDCKTGLYTTAKMFLWNETKMSLFCPNPSPGFHFTQSNWQNPHNGHKAPWLGPPWYNPCSFSQCSKDFSYTNVSNHASVHLGH